MKRVIFTIVALIVVTFSANGQATLDTLIETKEEVPYVFGCEKFIEDYNVFQGIVKDYYNYTQLQMAKKIKDTISVDKNGAIHLDYVINCNQDFDIQKAMETSVEYFNYAFSNAASAIQRCDYDEAIIIAHGTYSNIAQYNLNLLYYVKIVKLSADTDIVIRFKNNRIRIEATIRHYRIISADSFLSSKNDLVQVGSVYPYSESDNKIAYARAFLNGCLSSFDKIAKYIEFMNSNMEKSTTDDW